MDLTRNSCGSGMTRSSEKRDISTETGKLSPLSCRATRYRFLPALAPRRSARLHRPHQTGGKLWRPLTLSLHVATHALLRASTWMTRPSDSCSTCSSATTLDGWGFVHSPRFGARYEMERGSF